MEKIEKELCALLGVSAKDTIIKMPQRAISFSEFFKAVIYTDSLKEACVLLGLSYNSLKYYIFKQVIPLIPEKEANSDWSNYLLSLIKLKKCSSCKNPKSFSNFSKASISNSGLRSVCRECASDYQLAYKEDNRGKFTSYQAKRNAARMQRTPKWANIQKIEEIYEKCPVGYQVDHIIPLQGDKVSGLHVENNLQYLEGSLNQKKGNHYNV